MSRILDMVSLLRPKHYIKNVFIVLPLFFSGQITNIQALIVLGWAFISFSLAASAVYIFNDAIDLPLDSRHPRKKLRPLASGRVSLKQAYFVMSVVLLLSLYLMVALSLQAFLLLLLYLLSNVAYSLVLKRVAIIDVIIVASGFVIRLVVGAIITGTVLTPWIVIMTFLLCIFLALAKRRDDVLIYVNSGEKMRCSVQGYSLAFIDGVMMMMAAVIIVSYIMYTTSLDALGGRFQGSLYYSSFFVILGLLRYLQITFVESDSGSPTRLLYTDSFLQISIIGWLFTYVFFIYFL